jgi:hypothetical protein
MGAMPLAINSIVESQSAKLPEAQFVRMSGPRLLTCRNTTIASAAAEEGPRQMKFTLMTRKGHKQQLKDIAVPVDSALVQSVQKHKV